MPALMGVILCGGESRRMGRDKGLLQKDDIPWAKHMADKLMANGLPVVFSINASQADTYALALPGARLVVDNMAAGGPLKGLLSVHEQFPDKDLLLLACDMIDMDAATIERLMEAYLTDDAHAFYAYREGDFFEPLCAIYTSAGLAAPHTAALAGDLQVPSLQQLLRQGKTKSLPILNNQGFRNYNKI